VLTEHDIEFIKANRRELIANRTLKIIVKYKDVNERDPFTGEPIGDPESTREVDAVVTEVSAVSAGVDREYIGGVEVLSGDLRISVAIELIADIADKLVALVHDGKEYEILAYDKKGIGERNRYELLARRRS
jgi:hypothetical protein